MTENGNRWFKGRDGGPSLCQISSSLGTDSQAQERRGSRPIFVFLSVGSMGFGREKEVSDPGCFYMRHVESIRGHRIRSDVVCAWLRCGDDGGERGLSWVEGGGCAVCAELTGDGLLTNASAFGLQLRSGSNLLGTYGAAPTSNYPEGRLL